IADLVNELQTCHLVATNDTGTMHLSAALGVPTVAVFGSTEPAFTAPIGEVHRVIRHQVDCSPCFLRECPIDYRCMLRIKPETVLQEMEALLAPVYTPL
ncbi:MAG: glycosyltransferase family 9 protein, partial [Verrucomicrobiota bacterium]